MEIALPEVVKFCVTKMIKTTQSMSPYDMINLFQDVMTNFSLKNVSCIVEVSSRVMRASFEDPLQTSTVLYAWKSKLYTILIKNTSTLLKKKHFTD